MELIADPASRHADLLRDESQRRGVAEAVVFPESGADVAAALREAAARGWPVTVQGSRTGIVAGAVPEGGLIVNLSRMDRVPGVRFDAGGTPLLRVQPGLTLAALRRLLAAPPEAPSGAGGWTPAEQAAWRRLARRRWRFTPDPTETTASVGGMIACNASGARSFRHGPTRPWVEALTVMLADGDVIRLRRGGERARGRFFRLRTAGGRELAGELPGYNLPAVKHAAGYWVRDDMELIDLFIGSEGTLGIVIEAELRLAPCPARIWGIHAFLPSEAAALDLTEAVRGELTLSPVALEYFDGDALALLRAGQARGDAALPPLPAESGCALYLELAGEEEAPLAAGAAEFADLLARSGGRAELAWVAIDGHDLERLKQLRHAVPEQVNLLVAERRRGNAGLAKAGTDLAVPPERLRDCLAMYRRALAAARLESVVFGHIGDSHLHVNILPRDTDEYRRARELGGEWARRCVAWGGTVAAEHGIGKLKTGLLEILHGAEGVAAMRRLKTLFDPAGLLNRGTLFPPGD
jgi:D-lactate dehydrogenase (cytochrome)